MTKKITLYLCGNGNKNSVICECDDVGAAIKVLAKTIRRPDLQGSDSSVLVKHWKKLIATHRFDAPIGHQDNWRGREGDVPWPRAQRGKSPLFEKEEGHCRMSIILDARLRAIAHRLGDGNVSQGVRAALMKCGGEGD